jgi:hypothetical protein
MTMHARRTAAGLTALLVLLVLGFFAPAATAKSDKAPDSPGGQQQTALTEDTDDDGQPECPDPSGDTDNMHPSGKDRHCDATAPQGHSTSTPDQNTTGPERDVNGTDKAGEDGGADVYDQDGNNGCGNDDDFEDDNEGWCGGKVSTQSTSTPDTPAAPAGEVQGAAVEAAGAAPAEVLGVVFEQSPPPAATPAVESAALARTGGPFGLLTVVGAMLIAFGAVTRRAARR